MSNYRITRDITGDIVIQSPKCRSSMGKVIGWADVCFGIIKTKNLMERQVDVHVIRLRLRYSHSKLGKKYKLRVTERILNEL